jgi:ABC-2 type transport system ATP-binding protein
VTATAPADGADGSVIRCRDVVKRFGALAALDRLELDVAPGRIVGYLGPNGAGKSTTIRILLDLARADSGEVRVLGQDPRAAGPALRRRIGYLPGELRLDDRLTVDQTLRAWARIRGNVEDAYVDELCSRLGLDRSRSAGDLSSGNRRKVGLVGALMARPELLILDEPTSGVDPLVQEAFLELVREARDEGRTVFLSSHDLSEVQRVADEVVVIRSGRTVATGSVEEVRGTARQTFLVRFDGPVPEAELRALASVDQLEVHGQEATGRLTGPPGELLRVLAGHRVDHLVMPEPDLEEAFLHFYEEEAPA